MRRVLVVAALALGLLPAPARADYFTVQLETREWVGSVTTVVCVAHAETSVPGWVAAQTTVRCRIDDVAMSASMPGPKAVVPVVAQTGPSFLVCVSGAASFVSVSGGRVHVTAGEQCTAWDH
jgi:hypothetical protein